jgi:CheY-like chemotaxis protein/mannose-6-phosphate isomerase-like protein (cupin superfamily)
MPLVDHPWGSEETWAATDRYVGKTILLRAGASTGPLCHRERDKTLRVQRGRVTITVEIDGGRRVHDAHPRDTAYVPAGVTHQLTAVTDSELIEVSAPERARVGDVAPRLPSRGPGAAAAAVTESDLEIVIDDPVVASAADAKPPRPVVQKEGAPVVVVVEDDLLIQDILVRALGTRHTVYCADDGVSALALIMKLPRVDLVITDLMMPRMNGLELMRNLKADRARSRVPVIMLSARAASADVANAINAGARSYVTKPFKLKELMAQVDRITSQPAAAP